MSRILAIIAGFIILAGYVLYNSQIYFGNSRPSLAVWLLWSFLVILNIKSYVSMSKDWVKSVVPAASALACLLTTIVVIVKGSRLSTLGVVDWILFAIGIIACIIWFKYKKAEYANLLVVLAVIISFLPIYYGIWQGSVAETPFPWKVFTVGYSIGAAGIVVRWREEPENKHWTDIVYHAACMVLHLIVAVMSSLAMESYSS